MRRILLLVPALFVSALLAQAQPRTPQIPWEPATPRAGSPSGLVSAANVIGRWDTRFAGPSGVDTYARGIAVGNDGVYVGGYFTTVAGGTVEAKRIARWDGAQWHEVGGGVTQTINFGAEVDEILSANGRVFVSGTFNRAGGLPVGNLAAWDGARWDSLGGGVGMTNSNPWVTTLASSGSTLYVGGRFNLAGRKPATNFARWDGQSWSTMGATFDHWIEDIAVEGERVVAVGYRGDNAPAASNVVAEWNGTAWRELAHQVRLGTRNGRIDAVTIWKGDIYVGGLFSSIDGVEANSLARWDGQRWWAVGNGVDSNIWRLDVYDGQLLAAGLFRTVDNIVAGRIALWNGASWTPLGTGVYGYESGFNGRIDGVAVDRDRLFVAGDFMQAGLLRANNVAMWQAGQWRPLGRSLGNGISGTVSALAMPGSDVVAGGHFSFAGSTALQNLARWDGHQWTAIENSFASVSTLLADGSSLYVGGSTVGRWRNGEWTHFGFSGWSSWQIRSLALGNGQIFAAGQFNSALGSARRVVRWDGSQWQPMDEGLTPSFRATLLAAGTQSLYLGGSESGGNVFPARVYRWNGQQWTSMSTGMPCCANVRSLAVVNGELFAAGPFGTSGTYTSRPSFPEIMRWDGQAWVAVRSSTDYISYRLVSDGTALYALGGGQLLRWNGMGWDMQGDGVPDGVLAAQQGHVWLGGSFTRVAGQPSYHIAHFTSTASTAAENVSANDTGLTLTAFPSPSAHPPHVRFALTTASEVRLTLHDLLGRQVAVLAEGVYVPGTHTVDVASNWEDLSAGTYLCRLSTGTQTATLLLTKVRP